MNTSLDPVLTVVAIFTTFLTLVYFIALQYLTSQTIGAMLLNLRVISENKELKFWQCVLRNLYLIPFFPFNLLLIIDPIYVFLNKKKQRLTERWSKTMVV